jgi:uncharacterized protein (DUF2141 family)
VLPRRAAAVDAPQGTYALAVLHDEDGNERLDRAAFGVLREGIGASNGAVRRLGPPRFEDAKFTLGPGGRTMTIELKYWL